MSNGEFFQKQQEHSFIKVLIAKKYFWSWANVMLAKAKTDRICYIKAGKVPASFIGPVRATGRVTGWRDNDYVCAND
jgi:hypothetical protein